MRNFTLTVDNIQQVSEVALSRIFFLVKQENKETNLHLRCVFKSFTNQITMARLFRYNLFAIFAILSSTAVLVSSLPTSVLVDAKQQQNEQTSTAALNKGNKLNFARDFFFNFSFYISEQWENWNQTTNVFCCNSLNWRFSFQAALCIHFDLINLKERSMKFIVASSNNAQKYIVFDVRACIAVA